MKLQGIVSAVVLFASVLPALAQTTDVADSSEQAPLTPLQQALSQAPDLAASSEPVPFTTIEQGQGSRFSTDNPDVQPVFSDPESWKSFWEAYTEGREPRPELPAVDFTSEMVIVSALGEVSGVSVNRSNGILSVSAAEANLSASSPQATSPFHIIKTGKLEFQAVVFERPNPAMGLVTGAEMGDGTDLAAPATPGEQTQDLSARIPVPHCVHLAQSNSWTWWRGWRSHAVANNHCGYPVRLRMIWAWALDGACHTVTRLWYEERRGLAPYVSELRYC